MNKEQKDALRSCCNDFITVIIGPGGTGKTEIAAELGKYISQSTETIHETVKSVVLGPTGSASDTLKMRLGEFKKNFDIRTIHSWILRVCKSTYAELDGIEHLLIDESSMMNLWLSWHLIKAAKKSGVKRIIFFGDDQQLPPVENDGTLLHAFSTWKDCTSCFRLIHNYRTDCTEILDLLEIIRKMARGEKRNIKRNEIEKYVKLVVVENKNLENLFQEVYKELCECNPENTRILVGIRAPFLDPIKTKNIYENDKIEECRKKYLTLIYNRFNNDNKRVDIPPIFYPDDLVMCGQNIPYVDNNDGLMLVNGSIGRIIQWNYPREIKFKNCLIRQSDVLPDNIDKKVQLMFNTLSPGSITTVHKAQGTEHHTVIVVLSGYNLFFTVQLLYTACSRARNKLVIIMEENILNHYETNPTHVERNTQFNSNFVKIMK
jgi:ATP-dependent exoDNAse (exonuclease V) alpha subunit